MITVKLISGLGNQMFQYAAGFAIAHRNNAKLKCDISFFSKKSLCKHDYFGLDKFNITAKIKNVSPLMDYRYFRYIKNIANKMLYGHKWIVRENANQEYYPDIIHVKNSCYLQGYWQSEKYFIDCEDEIRKEFQFKDKLKAPEGNAVAIHIRRGDYVKFANLFLSCTPLYYENAIAYILGKVENPVFYVFSEDVEWCRENVKIPEPCFYINNSDKPPSHDMQLMSLCKHNIISNSSYSWWAAWLNQNPDKIVVAPDKWLANGKEIDIYTSNMVKISTTEEIYV